MIARERSQGFQTLSLRSTAFLALPVRHEAGPASGAGLMAEREGFEPSVRLPVRSLSKGVLSTTQPPFRVAGSGGLNHSAGTASTL